MNPEQKNYILEHAGKKSPEEIAAALKVPERKVRKFLERNRARKQHAPAATGPSASKKTVFLSVLLIAVLGFAVYGNSIHNAFIWDDEHLVENNTYIRSWSHLKEIFTQDLGRGAGKEYNYYRPTQGVSYLIDHTLWGLDPRGYHFSNILMHVLVSACLYAFINALFHDNLLALLTGSFYVVHPVHTEVVTYISGRADAIALLFMLLCFIFYIKSETSRTAVPAVLALFAFALALISRENSLILPALLLLYHYSFKVRLRAGRFLSLVGLAVIYIVMRLTLLKHLLSSQPESSTVLQRLAGAFLGLSNYIRLLFMPFGLHMEYGQRLFHWNEPGVIAGVVIMAALIVLAFRKREKDPLIFFAVLWFIIALLPVFNLFPLNAYMAEHWLYLPSIGFFLILARLISTGWRKKNMKALTAVVALGFLAFTSTLTFRQNTFWSEPLGFYMRTLKYAPGSSRVHYNIGVIYKAEGENEKARDFFEKAIAIRPDYDRAYNNLGIVYAALSRREDAVNAYRKAIEIKPDLEEAYYNLGNVISAMGDKEEAVELYKKAIALKPDYAMAYNNLGVAYADMGKNEEALAAYKRSIEIDPGNPEVYSNLGVVYAAMNRGEDAIALYERTIQNNPDDARAYYNLANALYLTQNKAQEAIALYEKAIRIKPDYAEAYYNLGNVYAALKRNEDAVAAFRKATKIDPGHAGAFNNLGAVYLAANKMEEALAAYEQVVAVDPGHAGAYYNLGLVYTALGMEEKAIASYKKAIELKSDHAMAYNNLAVIYFKRKQYPLAMEYCDKARSLGHENATLLEALTPLR